MFRFRILAKESVRRFVGEVIYGTPRLQSRTQPGKARSVFSVCVTALTVGLFAGCNDPDLGRPARVPVSGVVRLNNQPVADATVIFVPTAHRYGATGRTDEEGRFKLQTFEPGDGAVAGHFTVTVKKVEVVPGAPSREGGSGEGGDDDAAAPVSVERSLIPEKYGRVGNSGMEAEVSESGPQEFNFDLD